MNLLQTLQTCCYRFEIESQINPTPTPTLFPSHPKCSSCLPFPGNQVSPSRDSPDSGDVPSFPSDFSLHASPIEIERDSLELEQNPEIVHRTLHQPHEDVFLTPSTSTTKIPIDEAERKTSVAIENDLYPKLDESGKNARISGAVGRTPSKSVQEKSKNAELTNSVSVIYFKITKSEKEDPCESGSETSLCDDEKVEPEQVPVNQCNIFSCFVIN
jgi:hypothetical protein